MDTEGEARWRLRLRRAFGVPDIVSDKTSLELIADRLITAGSTQGVEFGSPNTMGALLDALVNSGATGELDRFICNGVDGRLDPDWHQASLQIAETIMTRVDSPPTCRRWLRDVAASVLLRLKEHIDDWPFEDGDRYYCLRSRVPDGGANATDSVVERDEAGR